MYNIVGEGKYNAGKKLEIVSLMYSPIPRILFTDGTAQFQRGIDRIISGIRHGDKLFVSSPTKKELDIGKQFVYELFK